MNTQRYPVALLMMSVTVLVATFWWRKRRRAAPPRKWRHVGDLAEITLYPLKSGRAVDLREARCTSLGLQTTQGDAALHDRFLAVYNGNSREYSHPLVYTKLRLISVTSGGNGVVFLSAPGMPQLEVTLPEQKDSIDCKFVFDHKVFLADCGDEAGEWVSRFLGREDNQLRLGYHSPRHMAQRRKINKKFWTSFRKHYTNLKEEYMGTFANLSSYLLLTRSSMDDLQKRLSSQENFTIKRFRTNLVVSGCPPYDEDNWQWVRIGDHVIFQAFRVCTRCSNTTIDPDTGVRDLNMEPLRTLKTYRKNEDPALNELEDGGPRMGLNMGLYSGENYVVKVGDPVYVGEAE